MRRANLALAVLIALGVASVARGATARAAPVTLAPVGDQTTVAAYGGYVAWSEKGADRRWHLVLWHDGARRVLTQIASRGKPFDVDLGPDAAGRPTAVFSRCAPRCRLRAVLLPDGGERPLALRPSPGASDSTPALWRDRVVFQRRRPGQRVSRLIAYDFTRHRATLLRHGTVPRRHGRATGAVEAIDLNAGIAAFVWSFTPAQIGVEDEEEVRAERLSDRRMVLGGIGYTSGECGLAIQASPNATATGALFLTLALGLDETCADDTLHSAVSSVALGARAPARSHVLDGTLVRGLARDAATGVVYAVTGRDGHLALVRA